MSGWGPGSRVARYLCMPEVGDQLHHPVGGTSESHVTGSIVDGLDPDQRHPGGKGGPHPAPTSTSDNATGPALDSATGWPHRSSTAPRPHQNGLHQSAVVVPRFAVSHAPHDALQTKGFSSAAVKM
jgi:hypothetical protein